jgi:pectate lyase
LALATSIGWMSGCGPTEVRTDGGGGAVDAAVDAPGADAPSTDAPGTDAPGIDGGGVDAGRPPVDCSGLEDRYEVCSADADTCGVVFEDGAGCAAVCASAGLVCLAVHENLEAVCGPDLERPELTCAPESGHSSDVDALLDERVGFGRRAAGGDPSNLYRVTTNAASGAGSLRTGLESAEDYWIVFDIGATSAATIDLGDDPVRILSNKTVDGRGRDVTIDGALEMRNGVRDVILTDLRLTNSHGRRGTHEGDVLLIRGAGAATPGAFENRDIWIHHIDFFEGGDGLFDVRGGSRITVSWSEFREHSKGLLLSQAAADEIEGREMEMTFHHNYFNRLSRRGPRLTFGRVHYFNNYQYEWWEYGAASVYEAQFLSEHNIYQARPGRTCGSIFSPCTDPAPCGDDDYEVSKLAVSNDWAAEGDPGYVRSTGDLLLQDAVVQVRSPERVFTPDYPFVAEVADAALAARVRDGAGPRTSYCR